MSEQMFSIVRADGHEIRSRSIVPIVLQANRLSISPFHDM